MKTTRLIIPITLLASLTTACSIGKNQVAFVTSTELSVLSADSTTQDVSIGYDRHELVIAPAYPESGAIPPVYARLDSNASILNPEVRSIYATGQAAEIVTKKQQTADPEKYPLVGQRRRMVFGTTTTTGLKLSYEGGARVGFLFGHKRQEASVIPVRRKESSDTERPDYYGSVIAAQRKTASTDDPDAIGLGSMQFMATGIAAKNLAANRDVQTLFEKKAIASLDALKSIPETNVDNDTRQSAICDAAEGAKQPDERGRKILKLQRDLEYDFAQICESESPSPTVLKVIYTELESAGLTQG